MAITVHIKFSEILSTESSTLVEIIFISFRVSRVFFQLGIALAKPGVAVPFDQPNSYALRIFVCWTGQDLVPEDTPGGTCACARRRTGSLLFGVPARLGSRGFPRPCSSWIIPDAASNTVKLPAKAPRKTHTLGAASLSVWTASTPSRYR